METDLGVRRIERKAVSLSPSFWMGTTALGGGQGQAEWPRQQNLQWPLVASSQKPPHQEGDHSPDPVLLCAVPSRRDRWGRTVTGCIHTGRGWVSRGHSGHSQPPASTTFSLLHPRPLRLVTLPVSLSGPLNSLESHVTFPLTKPDASSSRIELPA